MASGVRCTGCSSIFGGTFLTNPYTTNKKGQGPAWANSLFEDNAEYGLGMLVATAQRRRHLEAHVARALEAGACVCVYVTGAGGVGDLLSHMQHEIGTRPTNIRKFKLRNA